MPSNGNTFNYRDRETLSSQLAWTARATHTHPYLCVCVGGGVDRKTGHRIDTNFRIPAKKSKFQVFRIVKYVSKRKDS